MEPSGVRDRYRRGAVGLFVLSVVAGLARQVSGTACPRGNGMATTVSVNSTFVTVFVTGCPDYSPYNQSTPTTPTYQNKVLYIPVNPVMATTKTYVGRLTATNATNSARIMGIIGVAVNGVGIYNDANAEGADAVIAEAATLDGCRAHASPDGMYHYHSEPGRPSCVYSDTAGQHSPMFGVMIDGIPIYGVQGDNGAIPTDLDDCNGHIDTTHSFYHYHVRANLTSPYVVKCLRGCVFSSWGNPNAASLVKTSATCSAAATQYSYGTTLSANWKSSTPSGAPPPPGGSAGRSGGWAAGLGLAGALAALLPVLMGQQLLAGAVMA